MGEFVFILCFTLSWDMAVQRIMMESCSCYLLPKKHSVLSPTPIPHGVPQGIRIHDAYHTKQFKMCSYKMYLGALLQSML